MIKRDIESNKKRKLEKKLSIFEIFILIISIVAFSYLLGDEFRLVSAAAVVSRGGDSRAGLFNPSEEITEIETPITDVIPGAPPPATPTPTPTFSTIPSDEYVTGQFAETVTAPGVPSAVDPAVTSQLGGEELAAQKAREAVAQASAKEAAARTVAQAAAKMAVRQIVGNLFFAAALYGATRLIVSLFGGNPVFGNQLAWAIAIGYATTSITATMIAWLSGGGTTALSSWWISTSLGLPWLTFSPIGLLGAALAVAIYYVWGHPEKLLDKYQFTCSPWQPEGGGANCEECNKADFECNKYKCESLGASCEFLRNEKFCYWHNRNDNTAPVISPWLEPLDEEKYKYDPLPTTLPSERGVEIKDKTSTDGCIGPATRLTFGVTLDELAKCRVSTTRTNTYDEMTEIPELTTGYSVYDHTITSLHNWGIALLEGQNIPFREDGKYEIFVRCMNTNEIANDGTFVFKYCVKDTPDVTAPSVIFTNPENNKPVQYGTTSIGVDVYLDKPVECKWSHNDVDYQAMTEIMDCTGADTPEEAILFNMNLLYKCTTKLTGLKDQTANKFYFRCNSHPEYDDEDPNDPETNRQVNSESYVYTLIGTRPLVIDSVSPDNTLIKDSTQSVKVTVQARTSAGYKDGEATCFIKEATAIGRGRFTNTGSYQHSVDLWLSRGSYKYSIECCDSGGNCDKKDISFSVESDFNAPLVTRAYNEGASLKIVTNEEAECVYDTTSCSYSFDEGIAMTSSDNINHFTDWNTDNNFYIKCQDDFGNQPSPDGCSMIIRPSDY